MVGDCGFRRKIAILSFFLPQKQQTRGIAYFGVDMDEINSFAVSDDNDNRVKRRLLQPFCFPETTTITIFLLLEKSRFFDEKRNNLLFLLAQSVYYRISSYVYSHHLFPCKPFFVGF